VTTSATVDELIAEMVERIVTRFDPVRIILFGSRARGDAQPDSDVDLLVVLEHVEDKHDVSVKVLTALSDMPICKDVLVTTPEEMERPSHAFGSLLRSALRDGKIMYERR
jgi:predicted nucleotidyltransferase